ncbi:hypothetical protein BJ138DRAFT_1118718 [Hygrophoropsis aurantiaca]|uniref:Uncharacterized protein n=1 Tax=Hygrophoropsis aurantiaca TaxID=72124 RepID=A0ACB7ZVL1_9AGAM|nr:hypothetical protein BJ138DRAFT_1118718 [Hygrophoropsis aurantiaca]
MIDVDEEVGTIVGNVPRFHSSSQSIFHLFGFASLLFGFRPFNFVVGTPHLPGQSNDCVSLDIHTHPVDFESLDTSQTRVSSVTLHPHLCGDSVVNVLESFYCSVLTSSLWFFSNLPSTLVLPSTISFALQVPGISSLIFPQLSSYHHLSLTIILFLSSVVCFFILYPATLVFPTTTPPSHLPQHS